MRNLQSGIDVKESRAFIETFTMAPKSSGPLDGLRFAVKDLMDVAGYTTTCGNPTWRDTHPVAVANAICVDQLLFAGAECIGKTVTDELAFGLSGENHFYGTPLNPKAPERVPGGSSSGSASAVACGLADFALGTDTGGSVRVPASNCGIFGMRPTHGAISVSGVNPLAPTFDTVGVLASNCEVLAKAVSVLLAQDIPHSVEIGTIHFLQDAFEISDTEVATALNDPVEMIKKLFPGKTRKTSLRDLGQEASRGGLRGWYDTYCQIQWAEIRSCLGSWVEATEPQLGPTTRVNFELVKKLDRKIAVEAISRRETYYRLLKAFLSPHDLLCMPTSPKLAPAKGSLGVDRTVGDYFPKTLSLTSIAGIGRLPQVSLPLGDAHGVPIGLSLLAGQGRDAFLLAAARMVAS